MPCLVCVCQRVFGYACPSLFRPLECHSKLLMHSGPPHLTNRSWCPRSFEVARADVDAVAAIVRREMEGALPCLKVISAAVRAIGPSRCYSL